MVSPKPENYVEVTFSELREGDEIYLEEGSARIFGIITFHGCSCHDGDVIFCSNEKEFDGGHPGGDKYGRKYGYWLSRSAPTDSGIKYYKQKEGGQKMSRLTTLTDGQKEGLSEANQALVELGRLDNQLQMTVNGRDRFLDWLYSENLKAYSKVAIAKRDEIRAKEEKASK